MMFLAVDPGSVNLGWCIFDIETELPVEWGDIDLSKVPYENRFMEINRHLYQITHKYGDQMEGIAVEEAVRWRGKKIPELEVSVSVVHNFGHVRFRGPNRNFMTRKYHTATWKASVTGSSSANKELVDRIVRFHFPDLPEGLSDHITDAIGIGLHHLGVRKIENLARQSAERRIE